MKFQIIAITALVVAFLWTTQVHGSAIYCGRKLADKMAMICDWGAYEEEKRSGMSYNKIGWFGPRTYHAYSGVKSKRGIVEDCCYQPCDISTLLSYC